MRHCPNRLEGKHTLDQHLIDSIVILEMSATSRRSQASAPGTTQSR